MKLSKPIGIALFLGLLGCHSQPKTNQMPAAQTSIVADKVTHTVSFSDTTTQMELFKTVGIENRTANGEIKAPATVLARVQGYNTNGIPIILFDDPSKGEVLAAYLQDLAQLSFARISFDRVKDLYQNGAATGKDLTEAQAELNRLNNAVTASEVKLREQGFNPADLKNAHTGQVWLVCDLPESELNILRQGMKCRLLFPSYPGESWQGNIQAIAEVLNIQTRKVRVRIATNDPTGKLRPGMYATTYYDFKHSGLMVPRSSVFSVNARYYVFVKEKNRALVAREVTLSTEDNELVEIASGIKARDTVVISHVYLLKGLAFGI